MLFHISLFLALLVYNQACTVNYNGRLLKEGSQISIQRKFYKVEDCQLQRAYQSCGTDLWYMINLVCEAIDFQKGKNRAKQRVQRFTERKLLSEACCLDLCTVSEISRYCP